MHLLQTLSLMMRCVKKKKILMVSHESTPRMHVCTLQSKVMQIGNAHVWGALFQQRAVSVNIPLSAPGLRRQKSKGVSSTLMLESTTPSKPRVRDRTHTRTGAETLTSPTQPGRHEVVPRLPLTHRYLQGLTDHSTRATPKESCADWIPPTCC